MQTSTLESVQCFVQVASFFSSKGWLCLYAWNAQVVDLSM